ncbi:hypothetical protein L873DRAFT_1795890 [Choiromyces venosus 120613-1]|uniref:WDHD1/CFT4 second beta-propeller domain-containing protein n=1 Tax=Choiromyces venosus 120613-1 TaxID=1336337 RepID=A0A3N4IYC0_9PEZI|nr:hypothetical protein L873DRAFT_1795890 [Choiromyces venosus 120613-1]
MHALSERYCTQSQWWLSCCLSVTVGWASGFPSDGNYHVVFAEELELVKKMNGIINAMDEESEACSKVAWHPDGRAFAAQTPTRGWLSVEGGIDIIVVDQAKWEPRKTFASGHAGDITDFACSPNEESYTHYPTPFQVIVPSVATHNLCSTLLNDSGPSTVLENRRKPLPSQQWAASIDSSDDILGGGMDDGIQDFIMDDDGAGYVEPNRNGKRSSEHLDAITTHGSKRPAYSMTMWYPEIHEPFQPGSTSWKGKRGYLCLNLIDFVWTVDQDMHHTIMVEFYDLDSYCDFHLPDPYC